MNPVRDGEVLDLLSDVARSFAEPNPARVRMLRDRGGEVDREMWHALAANGWLSILVPEQLGGAGLGVEAAAIVARRLGFAGFPEPFVVCGTLAPLLLAACDPASSHEPLSGVLAGDALIGVAWQGPRGGMEPADIAVAARADGDHAILDGQSRFVGVADADAYLVAARASDGVTVHLLDRATEGLQLKAERRADGTTSASISLVEVRVPRAEGLLRRDAVGADVLADALDVARVVVSAELVGLIDRVLELTLGFLRQRTQFGKPIGAFQALQHRAVDMWMQRELAVAALEAAIRVFDDTSSRQQRIAAASSAKARAASAAALVCGEALQLHGAIGFTDEYDLGLYINRALTLAPWLGGAAEHRRRYASVVRIDAA